MTTTLVRFDAAKHALMEARTIDEVKDVRDRAAALHLYVRQAGESLEMQNDVAEIKLRAERRAGELLAEIEKGGGGDRRSDDFQMSTDGHLISEYAQVLKDTSTSRQAANRWQLEATVPEPVFEEHVARTKSAHRELTSAGLLEKAKELRRERVKQETIQSIQFVEYAIDGYAPDGVYVADITEPDFIETMPEASVDMVFSDPPWDGNALIAVEALGRLAARVLKPGRLCAFYIGKMFLPHVFAIMAQHLEYHWTLCVFQPDNNSKAQKTLMFEAWRPVLVFRKPGPRHETRWIPDALRSLRQKEWHEWQQGMEPVQKWIEALTEPGDLVLDPMVGGGTMVAAAARAGRHYLGFDKNRDAVALTLARLRDDSTTEVPQS